MGRLVGAGVPNNSPERLARVLEAKSRLIGIDVAALDAQVKQKQDARAAEEAEGSDHARASQAYASTLGLAAARAAAARSEWARGVAGYRAGCQARETRREWDLSRPDGLRLDAPARVGDEDPRCGPASMQRFDGEDLRAAERTEAQMQQAKAWWSGQAAEHAEARATAAAARAADAEVTRGQDGAQLEAAALEAAARRAARAAAARDNGELAAARAAARAAAAEEEAGAAAAALRAADESPWLNEDPLLAASTLSPTRVRKDHWKGMSPQQRAVIRAEQLAQSDAAKDGAAAAEAAEARAAAAQRDVSAALAEQALAAAAARRRQAAESAEALRRQIAEKAARDAALKEAYANRVGPEYFAQFGTSHR